MKIYTHCELGTGARKDWGTVKVKKKPVWNIGKKKQCRLS